MPLSIVLLNVTLSEYKFTEHFHGLAETCLGESCIGRSLTVTIRWRIRVLCLLGKLLFQEDSFPSFLYQGSIFKKERKKKRFYMSLNHLITIIQTDHCLKTLKKHRTSFCLKGWKMIIRNTALFLNVGQL